MYIGRNMSTPWGQAQSLRWMGAGPGQQILCVSTAGHGGLYVPAELLGRIPAEHRAWAASWSGSEHWYEEDCCWAAVAVAFPELFTPDAVGAAERTLAGYFPAAA